MPMTAVIFQSDDGQLMVGDIDPEMVDVDNLMPVASMDEAVEAISGLMTSPEQASMDEEQGFMGAVGEAPEPEMEI